MLRQRLQFAVINQSENYHLKSINKSCLNNIMILNLANDRGSNCKSYTNFQFNELQWVIISGDTIVSSDRV